MEKHHQPMKMVMMEWQMLGQKNERGGKRSNELKRFRMVEWRFFFIIGRKFLCLCVSKFI